MSAVGEFNFHAPQFVESLTEVGDIEDGADRFFDAEENTGSEKIPQCSNEIENTNLDVDGIACATVESVKSNDENRKPQSMKTRGRESKISRMSIKNTSMKKTEFMSMAEQLHKFHHGTPPRFKRNDGIFKPRMSKIMPTIAHSPRLQTKLRSRQSTASTISLDERTVLRPLKRTQVKIPPKPTPKPVTVPQPFNLTGSFKPKTDQENSESSKNKESVALKRPQKPVNVKKKNLEIENGRLVLKENWPITGIKTVNRPNSVTKTVPFSFEQRDQERLKAKEMKLQQAREAEIINNTSSKPLPKTRPSIAVNKSEPKRKRLLRNSKAASEEHLTEDVKTNEEV